MDRGSWSDRDWSSHERRWERVLAHYIDDFAHYEQRFSAIRSFFNDRQDWELRDFSNHYRAAIEKERQKETRHLVVFPLIGSEAVLDRLPYFKREGVRLAKAGSGRLFDRIVRARSDFRNKRSSIFAEHLKFSEGHIGVVGVTASSPLHAHSLAMDRITPLLGLIDFVQPQGRTFWADGLSRPPSRVIIGPHVSVHSASGSLSTEVFWYDRWMSNYRPPRLSYSSLDEFIKFFLACRVRIQESPWSEDARRILGMYYSACIEWEAHNSFLGFWRVLEFVAGGAGAGYDALIRRASFFWKDNEAAELRGAYFREMRNSLSHQGEISGADHWGAAYQLREFIRPILRAFLFPLKNFNSKEDFWEFCSLSPSIRKLKVQIDLRRLAQKFVEA